jgi:hypothetical protein
MLLAVPPVLPVEFAGRGSRMKGDDRKAAIAAYKERKSAAGIYLVQCKTSDEVWVGQSPNLNTIQNRIWFTLRFGSNPNQSLQKAWCDHGAENFAFEVIERLADDEPSYSRDALLKERTAYWRSTLHATLI